MDVMMKMTTDDVCKMRALFSTSLTLDQFVPMIKSALRDRVTDELAFVVGAVDLFHTIDVNGDATLEWDEFAGYMLDAGLARADFGAVGGDDAEKRYKAWPLTFKDAKTPMNRIKTHVQQIIHLPDLQAVAFFEHLADVVYIYALQFDQNDAPRHLATVRLHTAFQEHAVLDICYVPGKHWLVVSSMRVPMAYLSVWQMPDASSHSHSPMLLRRIELASPQEQLTWLPSLQLLATASAVFPSINAPAASSSKRTKIHQLLLWDLSTLTTTSSFDHRERIKGVTSIAGFATPSNRVFLVAGRDDGQLTVVETETGRDVQTLDAHGHGVRVLAHSMEGEVLASAGAHAYASDETDHHILIWRLDSSGRLVHETTLRDHESPLELLRFVDSKQQLLSSDIHGVFRVYSFAMHPRTHEKWHCVQVFQSPHHHKIHQCLVVPETPQSDAVLVAAGTRVDFFDHCVSRTREEVLFAFYCRELNVILGITATTLLLWQADTGKPWKSYTYASMVAASTSAATTIASEDTAPVITAACVDDRERKAIVGDDKGSVRVINLANGNVMKALDPHSSSVLWLAYALKSKRVVSVSLDGELHVCDENNPVGYYVPYGAGPQSVIVQALRLLPDPTPVVTATATEEEDESPPPSAFKFEAVKAIGNQALNLLAVLVAGSKKGESFIQLWNLDLSHAQGTCVAPLEQEITCLSFVGDTSDVVAGTATGGVYQWTSTAHNGYCVSTAFDSSAGSEPQSPGLILHVLTTTVGAEAVAPSTASSDEPQDKHVTFLTEDGSDGIDGDEHEQSRAPRDASFDGSYAVAADDNGLVSVWRLASACITATATNRQFSASSAAPTTTTTTTTTTVQHEQTVLGYEAVAALYANGLKRQGRHRVQPLTVRPAWRWKAHHAAITSLQQSQFEAHVLLTSSASGKIKIWTINGDLLGVLDYFATRRAPERRPWQFPVDMAQRQRRKEAYARRYLDRHSAAYRKRVESTRLSVLQERLSITPEEMANERASVSTPKSNRRRHSTVNAEDVGKAIRKHVLAQAVASRPPVKALRSRTKSMPSLFKEAPLSLHQILSDVPSVKELAPLSEAAVGNGRRRYPMTTVGDVKHALRPRSQTPQQRSTTAIGRRAVPEGLRPRTHEVATIGGDTRLQLHDLRHEVSEGPGVAPSLSMGDKAAKKKADTVLNYHVKLAHSWSKYSAS